MDNLFHYFIYRGKNRNGPIINHIILFLVFVKWQDFFNFYTSGTYPVSIDLLMTVLRGSAILLPSF